MPAPPSFVALAADLSVFIKSFQLGSFVSTLMSLLSSGVISPIEETSSLHISLMHSLILYGNPFLLLGFSGCVGS